MVSATTFLFLHKFALVLQLFCLAGNVLCRLCSNEVRGLDNYVKVVRWWMQHHEPSEDFWVKTPIENISDRALSELRNSVPGLGDLR